jgi:transposase
MPKRNELRPFTDEEHTYLEKLRRSRTAAQQHVERATILLRYATNEPVAEIAAGVNRRPETVWNVVKRFNQYGLASLQDIPRAGRPVTYGEEARGQMILTAKTHPQQLGLPYSHWTLDRLVEYVHQCLQLPISRSQLGVILEQEGLKWYQEKTYFTESPDPQFVEKRGRL